MKRIIAASFLIATFACRSNDPAPNTQTTEVAPSAQVTATQADATPPPQPTVSSAPPMSTTAPTSTSPDAAAARNVEADLAKAARVNATDLKKMVDAGQALIVDVRPASAFAEGHIKGAVNIPLSDFATRMGELPKDKYLATYCT